MQECQHGQPRKRNANGRAQTVFVAVPFRLHRVGISTRVENENLRGPDDADDRADSLDDADAS